LLLPPLPADRLASRLEAELRITPAKAVLVDLENANLPQYRALNGDRENLYALPTNILFLASQEAHSRLLTSAHDLVTWIAPPYTFALPETSIPDLPPPPLYTPPALADRIRYHQEGIQRALERDDRQEALRLLPPLADLYLDAAMYDAAQQVYQALADHYEQAANERQAILFTRRRDTAQGWRILAGLRADLLSLEDRLWLRRLLDEGLLSLQRIPGGVVVEDETGRTMPLDNHLLLTLGALSDRVAIETIPSGERSTAIAGDVTSSIVITGDHNVVRLRTAPHRAGEHEAAQRALAMARRVLAILEEQAAAYTALTIPAHLKIELEEKRREVADLEARLRALEE
jgi:hypothetical protein